MYTILLNKTTNALLIYKCNFIT